jgi:hypothetical protein
VSVAAPAILRATTRLTLAAVLLLTGCATTAVYRQGEMTVSCTRPALNAPLYAGLAAVDMGSAAATAVIAVATAGRVWVWWGTGGGSAGISHLETERYSTYAECKSALEAAGYERER